MSDPSSTLLRYRIVDPDPGTPAEARPGRHQAALRVLTWAILSVCLALWAVIGFLFWIPLLLRSMLHFSLALIDSMLKGVRPVEAGRVLLETVDFYRRGFRVAIGAVFGEGPEPVKSQRPMPGRSVVMEIGWALLVWYAVLVLTGMVETTPAELWRRVAEYPWREVLVGLRGAAAGASGGLPADSVSP